MLRNSFSGQSATSPPACREGLTGGATPKADGTCRLVARWGHEHGTGGDRDRGTPRCGRADIAHKEDRRRIVGDEVAVSRGDPGEQRLRRAPRDNAGTAVDG